MDPEKTVRELQGVPCLRFEDEPPPKQQIMVSRSFGAPVTQGRALAQAVTEFMTRAAEKLRAQQSLAGAVGVFIATSPFKTKDRQYSGSLMVPLPRPSADTPVLLDAALSILRALYRRDHRYARAGILLMDLRPDTSEQAELDLFTAEDAEASGTPDRSRLMKAMDVLNHRYGRGTVTVAKAEAHTQRAWVSRQLRLTPRYTTHWDEMPIVRA